MTFRLRTRPAETGILVTFLRSDGCAACTICAPDQVDAVRAGFVSRTHPSLVAVGWGA